jgi:hypothetical protein
VTILLEGAPGNRIAKAINIPLAELVSENGALKSTEELVKRKIYVNGGGGVRI